MCVPEGYTASYPRGTAQCTPRVRFSSSKMSAMRMFFSSRFVLGVYGCNGALDARDVASDLTSCRCSAAGRRCRPLAGGVLASRG